MSKSTRQIVYFTPWYQRNQTIPLGDFYLLKSKKMNQSDFTTTIVVDQTPAEVFRAITNPRAWWSEEIEGGTEKLNDVFDYHFRDVHICKMKLTEVVPDEKVVWLVLDNYFNFIKDQSEWKGTKIIFEISEKDKKTQIRFTHEGLVPAYECYDICFNAWTGYIQDSLFNLITTGKGKPNNRETPRTEHEKSLAASN